MKITVIDTPQELLRIKELAEKERFLLFPIFSNEEHPIVSKLPILVLAKPLKLDEIFVIGISHHETLNEQLFDFTIFKGSFIYNKKYFNLTKSLDLEACYYINNDEYTINLFKSQEDWRIYPIYKIVESLVDDLIEFSNYCLNLPENSRAYKFLNEITIPVLSEIEEIGLKVDENVFIEKFDNRNLIKNGLVYTQYNYLTTTGRPSNRFGGVNYSALNKSDGSRDAFISRFENGNLYMLDYDSYHMRLIADLIKYELPKESIHTHFAKHYFNAETVTDEMYEESKKISFKLLYGGVSEEYRHIQYFTDIEKFINKLWNIHNTNGFIEAVLSNKHIMADSKTKLFNYLIQNYETEQNMLVLKKIFKETVSFESMPVLYTYDSIMFDVKSGEETEYLKVVKDIMEINGQFPVKMSVGKNYGNMQKI